MVTITEAPIKNTTISTNDANNNLKKHASNGQPVSTGKELHSEFAFVSVLKDIPAIGILFGALSGFFFATASMIVKLLPNIHPILIYGYR